MLVVDYSNIYNIKFKYNFSLKPSRSNIVPKLTLINIDKYTKDC